MPSTIWTITNPCGKTAEILGKKSGISTILTQLLLNRKIDTFEKVQTFLHPSTQELYDPFLLSHMDKACQRIFIALKNQELIVIYGDYDVDGITATALLVRFLREQGGQVSYYLPDRAEEGYGLNLQALNKIADEGAQLLITVDCGISAQAILAEFDRSLDIIITDHHEPPDDLPDAFAVINPKCSPSYPQPILAGVGVAFKLCQALCQQLHINLELLWKYTDIVALGTVADMVPLIGENRLLVKLGLKLLPHSLNRGICALLQISRVKQPMNAATIAFGLAPRLNAAGRMKNASLGVELLLTENEKLASELAEKLEKENLQRKQIEQEVTQQAEKQVLDYAWQNQPAIVIEGSKWHLGVIGIVASRLLDKFYRPIIIISEQDGIGKASCRSIAGIDIYQALYACREYLLQFGGHEMAAGLSIQREKIGEFREALQAYLRELVLPAVYQPQLAIDMVLQPEQLELTILDDLEYLEPCGEANPLPVFAMEGLTIKQIRLIGQEQNHTKIRVQKQGKEWNVLFWFRSEIVQDFSVGDQVDIAFFPQKNEWQERISLDWKGLDIRRTDLSSHSPNPQTEVIRFFPVISPTSSLQDFSLVKVLWKPLVSEKERLDYIKETALQWSEKILPVYMPTREKAYSLTQELSKHFVHRETAVCCYSCLSKSEQRLFREKGCQTPIKIMVFDHLETSDFKNFAPVLILNAPPPVRSIYQQSLQLLFGKQPVTVEGIFDSKSIRFWQMWIENTLPARENILKLYFWLKQNSNDFQGNKSWMNKLEEESQSYFSRAQLHSSLQILKELNLLFYSSKQVPKVLVHQNKKDLATSSLYRQLCEAKVALEELSNLPCEAKNLAQWLMWEGTDHDER